VKIVVYGPERRTGALQNGTVVDLSSAFAKYLREHDDEPHPTELAAALVPPDLAHFIEGGPRILENARLALEHLSRAADQLDPRGASVVHPADQVRLHAPRPQGSRVACAGGNYADHALAMAARFQSTPGAPPSIADAAARIRANGIWGFWKVDRASAGPDDEVPFPARAKYFDYEGEIAIVLGRRGKNIKQSEAMSYVWGVTISADWSIRGIEEPGALKFAMQKNFDRSHSLGPCIVVGELDPNNVDLETFVNGERRQSFNTRDMVFSFAEYIEYLSADLTLYPGDVISGGTAAGTAADSSPRLPDKSFPLDRFLKPGDNVEMKSPAIGSLRTRIVHSV
jgi:2-keto-4-pentenoate hydratase/2-oxohepta-3-ene-1,7-dioic acid hydratase in catechol pathway